ncbi:hypothetical protein ACFQ1M_11980 [Sungkyunkwania multivorans]|uniref:MipA/OmpV family protein n=1 Tax=Sungkyunkwania multivorans TaxID=1173618 RepID=A0ABW3D1C6_9FLAO
MKNTSAILFGLLCLLSKILIAQQPTHAQATKQESASYFLADVTYISDAVFMGRRDSIAAPYIIPSIGYYDRSGIYADASLSYLVGTEEKRVDLMLLTVGYRYNAKKLNGDMSATAYFYNDESYNVQSEVNADLTASLGYDFDILQAKLSAITYFTQESKNDFFLSLSLEKQIEAFKNNLHIIPTIDLNAGSQNFYEEYYRNNRLGNRKGQGSGGTDLSTIAIAQSTDFSILSLDLSLPIYYYHDQYIFSLNPVVSLPQNPAIITAEDVIFEEDLENAFFISLGISYWFETSKKSNAH